MKKALKPSFTMSDADALKLGTDVISALTNNPLIPVPKPTVVQLQAAWDAYNTSLGPAAFGSSNQRKQKNADKMVLITLLREECDNINAFAQGNEIILTSCGFRLSKDREPKVLGVPDAKVEAGANTGEVILSSPAVSGAVSYKHQYTSDPAMAIWPEITSSTAKQKIGNLQPGTVYSFRIVAIGTKGQVTVSETVTKMAA